MAFKKHYNMKAIIKIPRRAVDSKPEGGITMFSTIEYEVEGSPEEIEETYQLIMDDSEGLNKKEWSDFRNAYFMGDGTMNPDMQDLLHRCSKWQRLVINEMKLAIKNNK